MANKSKQTVRTESLRMRDALTEQERGAYSLEIIRKLTSLTGYQEAEAVLTYVSFRSEVETRGLIRQAVSEKKHVFVPKVQGREMEFYRITDLSELQEGYQGILEPETGESYQDYLSCLRSRHQALHTLMCMPGAAFDRKCRRIGYGGGFFDRYLERLAAYREEGLLQMTAIALAYACQVREEIPWESHDVQPDMILTEQDIIRRSL